MYDLTHRDSILAGVSHSSNARAIGVYAIKDLLVWNSTTTEFINSVEFKNGITFPIALNNANNILAIHGYEGEVFLVDPVTLQVISTLQAPNDEVIRDIVWHEDGIHLATFGGDRTIRVWNVQTGTLIETITIGELLDAMPIWRPGTNELTYSPVNASPVITLIEGIPLTIITCDATISTADVPALISAIAAANSAGSPQTICEPR